MVIFKKVADLQAYLSGQKTSGHTTGLVPTMGALHDGHLSLIKMAKQKNAISVCSVFVNPTQFNDIRDFKKYPVSTEKDIALLAENDCDILFLPSVEEMYPDGIGNLPAYNFGYLEQVLEGAHRPGHFRGVGQVVNRLFDIVQPEQAYFGQKDYQQCMVVKKLLTLTGKDNIEIITAPIIREEDGLAMSSRNRRLTESQRAVAGIIYQCLVSIQSKKENTPFAIVHKECMELLAAKGFAAEYVSLASSKDLSLLDEYNEEAPMVALIAAKIGDIRLIDNMLLN